MHARVIGMETRANAARKPIERDIGQHPVAIDGTFWTAVIISPDLEFFRDPGGKTGGGIRQAKGQCLRPRALNPLIACFFLQEFRKLRQITSLVLILRLNQRGIAPHREQIQVNPKQLFRMHRPQPRRYEAAPISALRAEAPVAKHVRHQIRQAIGNGFQAEPRLARLEGQAIARQGRCDDGEGILGIATEAGRLGQARNEIEEFKDRSRPTMRKQQRHRVWPFAPHMQEMQINAVKFGAELRKGVQRGFLRAPIKTLLPIGQQIAQIGDTCAVFPGRFRRFIRQARQRQAGLQILQRRIGYLQAKWGCSGGHAGLLTQGKSSLAAGRRQG